jgi:hypothetical protein
MTVVWLWRFGFRSDSLLGSTAMGKMQIEVPPNLARCPACTCCSPKCRRCGAGRSENTPRRRRLLAPSTPTLSEASSVLR